MMRILFARVLEGPNIFSYKPVLKVKLDLGRFDGVPSTALEEFSDRLIRLMPGLANHRCSRGRAGGFIERLREGTYLAHIFEHVVLELQYMAGYDVSFGKARSAGKGSVYDVVVGLEVPAAALNAAYEAEKLLTAVIRSEPYDVEAAVAAIKRSGQEQELGPSTAAIYNAALRRGIPVQRLGGESLLTLGYGHKQQRVWATITGKTGALAADLASDKALTKQVLAEAGIPVPEGLVVKDAEDAVRAMEILGGKVAVKPVSGNQGRGVTIGVTRPEEVIRAYQFASEHDERVMVESYIPGRQFRACVVNGKVAAVAERIPACVVGDGIHTVAQLVEIVNADPRRGEGHEKPLTKIRIDPIALSVLAKQNLTTDAVPEAGQVVYIRENANLSTGGTAVDVTDDVHPDTILLVERAARIIGLDVAGVDLVTQDITQPVVPGKGAVIEVNAAPGIRMHHYPSEGQPRDVAGCIVDALFPAGDDGRIPIIAVTGTNGKTTVTRMIGHIWRAMGVTDGMTTTDGIYIGGQCIMKGDTTGPKSAKIVLSDPRVEVAVLETARGGIVRGGLAFRDCDVGIVTNITEDHLGQDGVESLDDLAYIKALVVETVRPGGVALLNADDPFAPVLAARVRSEIVYFSTEAGNIIIRRHLGVGGRAFFVKDGIIYAAAGGMARAIVRVQDVPVTLGGIAQHNIQNAVIAAAACCCLNVPIHHIRRGLRTFDNNPGRLNIISMNNFRVCVDYGHNPAGCQALINTARRLGALRMVGVIAAPGDRRDDVIVSIGRVAGSGFDKIYIKEDSDLRGRIPGETAELLRKGVVAAGFAPENVEIILSEPEAVLEALKNARSGDLIVIFYENFDSVIGVIDRYRSIARPDPCSKEQMPEVVVAGVRHC